MIKLRNAAKEMIIAPQPGGQQLDKRYAKCTKTDIYIEGMDNQHD